MVHAARLSLALAFALAGAVLVLADDAARDSVILDVSGKDVTKYEANQSQVGFTSTRIFYTLASRNAIVVVHIDNSSSKFPVGAKVYQFAKEVAAEDLGKWVNNQHSDGLFPDVPNPIATHQLPAQSIKTVSSKRIGQVKGGFRGDLYDKYTVEFESSGADLTKTLKLGACKDSATAYIKAAAE